MNSPKYSVHPLAEDTWEVRYTKQVIRNILRAKEEAGLTTEELARRCDEVLGEPGAMKTSTLSGLFAGKRRSIGAHEVMMFATALQVAPLTLLAQASEEVEVRPGKRMSGVHAIRTFLGIESWMWGPPNPMHMWFGEKYPRSSRGNRETEVVVEHWAAEERLFSAFGALLDAIDRDDEDVVIGALITVAQGSMFEYKRATYELYQLGLAEPELPKFLAWVPHVDPSILSLDYARKVASMRRDELATIKWKTGAEDGSAENTTE